MTYALRTIRPGSVFLATLPVNLILGFLSALLTYLILPAIPSANSPLLGAPLSMRLLSTVVFTLIYGPAASGLLALVALLYNVWSVKFRAITIDMDEIEEVEEVVEQ